MDIESDVDVYLQLFRPQDQAVSEPKPFKYKPRDQPSKLICISYFSLPYLPAELGFYLPYGFNVNNQCENLGPSYITPTFWQKSETQGQT